MIEVAASEALDDLDETADVLVEAAEQETDARIEHENFKVSRDCPFGDFAHNREDDDGVHYWTSRQLDGLNGVAIKADCGVWLSFTWNPDEAPEEGDNEGAEG